MNYLPRIFSLLFVFTLMLFIAGCSKNEIKNQKLEEGIYKGNFTVTYNNTATRTGETSLELKDGRYTCSGNPDRLPAGGSGTYTVTKTEISFKDENFWTTEFDWSLITTGTFNYTFDGKNLTLYRKNEAGIQEYNLIRE